MELHVVAGLELPQLPEVGFDDGHRADETAQARAIRAKDDRHVASEIHGADGVRVVVDVRGVQARFATVGADPFRLGTNQADACTAGVEMHFPLGGEEGLDVALGEIFRRAMGAVNDPDLTHGRQGVKLVVRYALTDAAVTQGWNVQHVASPQSAAAMPAKLTQGERAFAAQIVRQLQPAAHTEVASCTGARDGAQRQG